MDTPLSFSWPSQRLLAALLTVSFWLAPLPALGAEQDATLELRPHCTADYNREDSILGPVPDVEGYVTLEDETCPSFHVEDPQTLRTNPLKAGDELDLDIVIRNPSRQAVTHARVWLSYDPDLLEGVSIDVEPEFPAVTPGESDFDVDNGYVMIEASTEDLTETTQEYVRIARVIFEVKETMPAGTPISFYDVQDGGHTSIHTSESGTDEYILAELPGSLHVVFATGESSASGSVSSTDDDLLGIFDESSASSQGSSAPAASSAPQAASEAPEPSDPSPSRTTFALLQVQNVRVTTEGTSLYITWNALKHQDIKGYNVYYGTTSGRYIQRKTVSSDFSSLTIRSLPFGTTYYVAVRAVSTNDEEGAFSREASVEVGDPTTSTAPLVLGSIGEDPGPNGVNPVGANLGQNTPVPGETGIPSVAALFVLFSALLGTGIAWRRQAAVSVAPTHQ